MPATHKYGKDYRIKISDGNATPAYLVVSGEGNFSLKRNSDKIDLSSKDDGFYKAVGAGQQEVGISVAGKLKTPDAGFGRLTSVSTTVPPETNIQIVYGANAVVVFQGNVAISNLSYSASNNGAVDWTCELYCSDAPTIDNINQ
jgi:predicted secreted protein